jgi:hypothetical protein
MNSIEEYKEKIERAINGKIDKIELISKTNNIVLRYALNGIYYFAKFYKDGETHTDNEVLLYENIPVEGRKYLKNLVYSNFETDESEKFAIYEEVKGKTLASLLDNNAVNEEMAGKIAKELLNYFRIVSKINSTNYGNLAHNFDGNYVDFLQYLYEYQFKTTETLFLDSKTRGISSLPYELLSKYADLLDEGYSCVTPIDSNFKNIMITDKGEVKIVDPGAIVSAPMSMGLGELVAHSYGTIIYDKLIEEMHPTSKDKKRLSIYGILSSMNVMAFLVRNKIGDINTSKPFGNKNTFFELIRGHLGVIQKEDIVEER